jgi:guanylate kinase
LNNVERSGILFVLSAPSGAGKTTLTTALRRNQDFVYSVSCTTRPPRSGEVDGQDYHFLQPGEFLARRDAGEFLEWAEVHGRFYGTLRSTVLENLAQGVDVLIDIDTAGAAKIRSCGDPAIQAALADVFLMPPGLEELNRRLQSRGTESDEQVNLRIANAVAEMRHWHEYRYTLLSGTMEEDFEKFRAVMRAERALSRRMKIPTL